MQKTTTASKINFQINFKSNFVFRFLFSCLLLMSFHNIKAQINVNSSGGLTTTTSYGNLKNAFDSINVGKHTGTIVITVTANTTETATAVLNASGAGSASYSSIIIKPTGGGLKTIATSLAAPLIDLNGADNVTIDGLYPGNDSLLLVNSSTSATAGTSTIRFINGATNNAIQNCGVFGGSASTTSGTIYFATDAVTANGNDNNLISKVLMGNPSSSATPRYAVYSVGTTNKDNTSNTIEGCWIYNFHSTTTGDRAGIYIGAASSSFKISGNSFFQEATRSMTSGIFSAIFINNTSGGNFIIRSNRIGGSAPECTGTPTTLTSAPIFQAIYLNVSTTQKTVVDSNEIANFTISTTSTNILQSLIHINNGKVDLFYNTLGSQSVASSISWPSNPTSTTFSAIGMGSGTFDTINISNNVIGGISISGSGGMSLRGIDITGSSATMLINNNLFGSTTIANSLNQATDNSLIGIIVRGNFAGVTHQIMNNTFANLNATIGAVRAILTGGATSTWKISGNQIYSISSSRTAAGIGSSAALIGILCSAGGPNQIVSNNKIYALKITGTAAMTVSGISISGSPTGTNIISGNLIHSLNVNTVGGSAIGIDIYGANHIYYNNMIRLGIDEAGNSITNAINFTGIFEIAGINSMYYNSIYIGGANVTSGTTNTHAFLSTLSTVSREIKNNIFVNVRSNLTSTGKHYAIKTTGIGGQVLNANDYWNGTAFLAQNNSLDYTSLGLWQIATTQDSISISANPNFKNATGSSANLNLHIDTAGTAISSLESSGLVINSLAIDYDNDARPGPTGSVKGGGSNPDIGADEFDGVPRPQCSNTTAGTAVALDTICLGNSVVISLTGATGIGVGNVFQWQISTNGITYSNISGANQAQYTATALTSTTYFKCIVTCYYGSTTSTSSAKKITVVTPQITSNTSGQRCGPGTVVLSAVASLGVVNWYSSATGGTQLNVGTTFTTPSLNTTTIYYVEANFNGCVTGARTAVTATINLIPTLTSTTSNSNCGTGSVLLSATTASGTINWYASATGGSSLGTGLFFNTPSISVTTIYYAEVTANGCVSSSRTPVTATILPLPIITSVTPSGTCGSGSVLLNATSNSGIISWFSASGGGTALDTGTTFTTPVLFAPTTYYVEAKLNNCVSATRTPVLASIYSNPNITGTTSANGCVGDKVILGATASTGTINWYLNATGGSSIATGNSFTTPALTTTTTYYVDATANGCVSNFRTPAKATINPIPTIVSVTGATSCGANTLNLNATSSSGIVYWYSDSIGGTLLTTGNTFNTPTLATTTVYYVEARDNGCKSYPRTPVTAKIRNIPTITGTIPATSCRPAAMVLSATASNGVIRWYSVPFGGSLLNTGNSYTTTILNATTTFYIEATDSGCTSATRTGIDATLYTPINKTTTVNGYTITAVASGLNYQWVNCNNGFQIISGATSQSYTATQNGSYAVILKNATCTDTSACQTFSKIGINNSGMKPSLDISPNPFNDYILVSCDASFKGMKFSICDLTGRVVCCGIISSDNQKISMENLSPGVYIFNTVESVPHSFKIIKN